MKTRLTGRFPNLLRLALAAALCLPAAGTGFADDVGHEKARRLVEEGKIRPLNQILAIVRDAVPGKVLETELEYDANGLVYDIKVLRPGGRIQEVELDAATGRIITIEDDE